MRYMIAGLDLRKSSTWELGRTRQRSAPTATMSAVGASPSRQEISPKKSPARSVCAVDAVDTDGRRAVEHDVKA